MSFRSQCRCNYFLDDFELPFGPGLDGTELIHIDGNRAVVGFLMQDEDCGNPMENNDAEGTLYTHNQHVITDDTGGVLRALGLTDISSREIYRDLEHDGVDDLARSMLRDRIFTEGSAHFDDFLADCGAEFPAEAGEEFRCVRDFAEDRFDRKYDLDCLPLWLETIYTQCLNGAWDELQEQGKIGEYLAVPVFYCSSAHGPGTTQAYTTSVDSANAAWVPDTCAIDNIKSSALPQGVEIKRLGGAGHPSGKQLAVVLHNGENVFQSEHWVAANAYVASHFPPVAYKDLYAAAERYCKGVLDNYVEWANGECYGVVVLEYENTGTEDEPVWEMKNEDACWGFIGGEYAQKELKSVFDQTVKKEG